MFMPFRELLWSMVIMATLILIKGFAKRIVKCSYKLSSYEGPLKNLNFIFYLTLIACIYKILKFSIFIFFHFPRKIAATVFRLKTRFKENTQGLFQCQTSENTGGGPNFEI